jgi:predicted transcriptional regulator
MTTSGHTKDEKFMLRLYEEALKQPEIDNPLDRYEIGQLIGLQQRAVETICNLLAQANFIKKQGKNEISITPHGIKLVENLKKNHS